MDSKVDLLVWDSYGQRRLQGREGFVDICLISKMLIRLGSMLHFCMDLTKKMLCKLSYHLLLLSLVISFFEDLDIFCQIEMSYEKM